MELGNLIELAVSPVQETGGYWEKYYTGYDLNYILVCKGIYEE